MKKKYISSLNHRANTLLPTIKEQLNIGMSCADISKDLGFGYSFLYSFIRKNGLENFVDIHKVGGKTPKHRQRHIRDESLRISKNKLEKLYWKEGKDLYEIAAEIGKSPSGVLYRMRKLFIPTRTRSNAVKLMLEKKPWLREIHRQNANGGKTGIFRKESRRYSFTKIEKDFSEWCDNNNILFIRQFQFSKNEHRYDFLLKGSKILIEVDGDYWHLQDKQIIKDRQHEASARDHGYVVIRFSDKEIKKTKSSCFDIIKEIYESSKNDE